MNDLFLINEEEKNRILGMHETATNRHYLSEQTFDPVSLNLQSNVVIQGQGSDPYQYMKWGDKVWYAKKSEGKNPKWIEAKDQNAIDAINNKIFKTNGGNLNKPSTIPNKTTVTSPKTKQKVESLSKKIGNIDDRILLQLTQLKKNNTLNGSPFIIVNKISAIASLFDGNYNFILKSSITSGYTKDKGIGAQPLKKYKNWLDISMKFYKENPTHVDSIKIKDWVNKNPSYLNPDGTINFEKNKENISGTFPFSYEAPKKLKLNFTPPGVFEIGKGHAVPGYAAGESTNAFPLVDPDTQEKITAAIHGYATKNRGDLITKADKEDVNASKDYTRAGSGCVNVSVDFVKKINEFKPKYVIILPDTGGTVDVSDKIKVTTFTNFSDKIVDIGAKCIKSIYSLFS
jgi:hypothetical protein